MNSRLNYNRFYKALYGFTLVEILVAVTIIVTVLSIVYGTYFAISKSAQMCKVRIDVLQEGQKVVGQMARQMRCSYAGPVEEHPKSISRQSDEKNTDAIAYFNCNTVNQEGIILHFVTTHCWGAQNTTDGLFEVNYKFDKGTGLLFLSQKRFDGTTEGTSQKRTWSQIAKNIEYLETVFFDGTQWLKNWDFKNEMKLPAAVKIGITCRDEYGRQYRYSTIAHIFCSENYKGKAQPEELILAGSL